MATALPAALPQIQAAPNAPQRGDRGATNAGADVDGAGFAQTLERRKEMKASTPSPEPSKAETKAPSKPEPQPSTAKAADPAPPAEETKHDSGDDSRASLAGDPAAVAALVLAAVAAAQTSAAPNKTNDSVNPTTPASGTAAPGLAVALAALTQATQGKVADENLPSQCVKEAASDASSAPITALPVDDGDGGAVTAANAPDALPPTTAPAEGSAIGKTSGTAPAVAEAAPRAAEAEAGDTPPAPASQAAMPESLPAGAATAWAQGTHLHSRHDIPALQFAVTPPPGHPQWADAVGNRVTWMVGQNEGTADLILTPPQLGRLEVSVTVSGDITTAQFVAATPAARDVLEQALPRLREVLAESGIMLADAQVSTSGQQGQGSETGRQSARRQQDQGLPSSEVRAAGPAWLRRGEGLVDTFA